jgi:radical SAM superfamily enzyme YgiQ (UPF0313 family)
VRIVLLSCYELGHAPHGLAMPAAFLARAGYRPVVQDLAVQQLDEALIRAADFVGITVPMHTALRLGAVAGARVRELNPDCHLCFYGLYAPLNADYLRALGADSVLGGECEQQLVALVEGRAAREVALDRLEFPAPRRDGLPAINRYAELVVGDERRRAGYTEASRGCLHMCRHCPIPPVYGGRFFVVGVDAVLADVAAQVEAGAEHVTFGDPDFFNGPGHAMRVLRAVHERSPSLTFDVTIKVEHLLRHAELLGELVALGCAFVVTAVESIDDAVLARLDKGHTRADVDRAFSLSRDAGLVLRPTFVPFTPWTSLDGLIDLVDFLERRELVAHIDPVQLTVRLLVPPGSLLLDGDTAASFGALDPAALTHEWHHADPRVDALQRAAQAIVEDGGDFAAVRAAYYAAAGRDAPAPLAAREPARPIPRLTEHWFC